MICVLVSNTIGRIVSAFGTTMLVSIVSDMVSICNIGAF